MKPLEFTKINMTRLSTFPMVLLASLILSLTLILPGVRAQQSQLSLADILIALRSNKVTLVERNEILTGAVKERGITFDLTPQIEKELENTGADKVLIDAIKQKSVIVKVAATPAQPKPTPSTPPATVEPPVVLDFAYYKKQADDSAAKGELDSALASYNKAVELSPKNAAVYLNRALVFLRKKDYEKAIADYDKVLEIDPKELIAYANRANSFEKIGKTEKAVADYKKILEIDAQNEAAINNLKRIEDEKARALQKQKDAEAAAALAQAENNKEKPKEEEKEEQTAAKIETSADGSQILDLGRLNTAMAIDMVTPVYSPVARSMNLQGEVTVQVTLDEKGEVIAAESTEGHRLLRNSAEQAARRSKFKPAMIGDKAVKAKGYIVYNFVR